MQMIFYWLCFSLFSRPQQSILGRVYSWQEKPILSPSLPPSSPFPAFFPQTDHNTAV